MELRFKEGEPEVINDVSPHECEVLYSSLAHSFGFSCPHLDEASEFYLPPNQEAGKVSD